MFTLTNELEQSLLLAMTDENKYNDFYQVLLDSNVHIYARVAPLSEEENSTSEQNIMIQHWESHNGEQIVPFFSSPSMLLNSKGGEEDGINIASKMLFTIAQDASLVLNPGTAFEHYFTPQQIQRLMLKNDTQSDEAVFDQALEFIALNDKPKALEQQLTDYFNKTNQVNRAWLVAYRLVDSKVNDLLPRLMIGIDYITHDVDPSWVEALTKKASESIQKGLFSHIDFITIKQNDSEIADYLINEIPPFYSRLV